MSLSETFDAAIVRVTNRILDEWWAEGVLIKAMNAAEWESLIDDEDA